MEQEKKVVRDEFTIKLFSDNNGRVYVEKDGENIAFQSFILLNKDDLEKSDKIHLHSMNGNMSDVNFAVRTFNNTGIAYKIDSLEFSNLDLLHFFMI